MRPFFSYIAAMAAVILILTDQLYFAAMPQSYIIFASKLREAQYHSLSEYNWAKAQYNSPQANITERTLIW